MILAYLQCLCYYEKNLISVSVSKSVLMSSVTLAVLFCEIFTGNRVQELWWRLIICSKRGLWENYRLPQTGTRFQATKWYSLLWFWTSFLTYSQFIINKQWMTNLINILIGPILFYARFFCFFLGCSLSLVRFNTCICVLIV